MAQAQGPLGERLLAVLEPRRASVIDRPDMISRHVTGAASAVGPSCCMLCARGFLQVHGSASGWTDVGWPSDSKQLLALAYSCLQP